MQYTARTPHQNDAPQYQPQTFSQQEARTGDPDPGEPDPESEMAALYVEMLLNRHE